MSRLSLRTDGPFVAFVIGALMITVIGAVGGCNSTSIDRQKVASTLRQADAYASVIERGLAPDDPLLPGLRKIRADAAPVITAVDAWASGDGPDPTGNVWALLDSAELEVGKRLDGDRLVTANRVLLGVRVALMASGMPPPPIPEPEEGSPSNEALHDPDRPRRPDPPRMQHVPLDRLQDGRSVAGCHGRNEQRHRSQRQHLIAHDRHYADARS